MLQVFICEDNPSFRQTITRLIQNKIIIENYSMEVVLSTESPYEVINYLNNNPETKGIYFLDVDLKQDINGIELGGMIREIDRTGKIIFVTTHSEAMRLTFKYKIEAMDYLLKDEPDNLESGIYSALSVSQNYFENDKQTFRIKIGNEFQFYDLNNVMFIETSTTPHKLILHLKNGQIEYIGKISDCIHESTKLRKVHKSFVVNCDAIQKIDKKERLVFLTNGESCSISQRYLKHIHHIIQS